MVMFILYYLYSTTKNRKRNVHLHVMVTPDELAAIHERMAEAGISNAGAYVRKMALNGYILHIDLAPVKELISLQRRCSNNLNQVAGPMSRKSTN